MLIEMEIMSDTLLLYVKTQYSTLTSSSNTIIDTQNICCLRSKVAVAPKNQRKSSESSGSAKKPAKK